MKLIDAIWFSSFMGIVGIVIVEDEFTRKRKAYVGTGLGFNERADTERVMAHGIKLHPHTVKRIAAGLGINLEG